MLTARPSSAPSARSPGSLAKPNQLQKTRDTAHSSPTPAKRAPLRRSTAASSISQRDVFEEEVTGTISRLRHVTGWNWGICAGIEMRAYSIAARALRRLVVDAAAQLQSSALVPAPAAPLADFFEADGRVTTDLHILLKHVQLASSFYAGVVACDCASLVSACECLRSCRRRVMTMVAASDDCDKECGSEADAAAALAKVDSLMMLMMPSRELVKQSAAAAEAAAVAAHAIKSLSVLKSQFANLRNANAVAIHGRTKVATDQLQHPDTPQRPPARDPAPAPVPSALKSPDHAPVAPSPLLHHASSLRSPLVRPKSSSCHPPPSQAVATAKLSPAADLSRSSCSKSPRSHHPSSLSSAASTPPSSAVVTTDPAAAAAASLTVLKAHVQREEHLFALASAVLLTEASRQMCIRRETAARLTHYKEASRLKAMIKQIKGIIVKGPTIVDVEQAVLRADVAMASALVAGTVTPQIAVATSDDAREIGDGEDDANDESGAPGSASHNNKQPHAPSRPQQQKPQESCFNFSNPHAISDLLSVVQRARTALTCSTGVSFEMESLGGVLVHVLHASHPLYNYVSLLPSGEPPQLSIAYMIMNSKNIALAQAAYLSAAPHFDSCFSASKLAASMCTPHELKSSGHSLAAMVSARLSTSELLAAPFTISQLKAAGCSAAQLKSASCSAADLKAASFTCSDLRAAKFDAFFLVQAGFSKADLKAAGFDAVALRAAGCSAGALKLAGFSLADLLAARFDAQTFLAAGFTITQLKAARFDAQSLKAAGCSASDLKKAGFSAAELRAANYDAPTLVAAGVTRLELKSAGYDLALLKAAGVSASALKAASFSAAELRSVCFEPAVLVSVGYSKSELVAAGLDTGALRANGCSIEKLKEAGYALGDLISARYDAPALLSAGYSLAELKSAKFDATQLKAAGCTVLQLRTVGFTLKELKVAGYDPPQLAEGGYLLTQLYGVGFDTASLRPALSPAWCIEHRGWFYRTLSDGWDPHSEGRNDQEGVYLPLPVGFEMVPEETGEGGSREVVARHPWSTSVIVLGNGVGWYTAACGSVAGSKYRRNMLISRKGPHGTEYSVKGYSGILIRTPVCGL